MTFRVDALYDLATGEQPLVFDKEAVAQGYFSAAEGRILISDSEVVADIISWTTSEIRFTPRKRGVIDDGTHSLHVDSVDVPIFATVQSMQSVLQTLAVAVTQDHETLVAQSLSGPEQILAAALTQDQVLVAGALTDPSEIQAGLIESIAADAPVGSFLTADLLGWTFTRASEATMFDEQYNLVTLGVDTPGATYAQKPGYGWRDGGYSRGIMAEPAETNYVTAKTTDITDWWVMTGSTVSVGVSAPDELIGVTWTEVDTGDGKSYFRTNFSASGTLSVPRTGSVFLKRGGVRYIVFTLSNGGNGAYCCVDTTDWVITESGQQGTGGYDISAGCLQTSEDTARIWLTLNHDSNSSMYLFLSGSDTGTPGSGLPDYTRTGVSPVTVAYGWQFEDNSRYPSSYIPTDGVAVTRADTYFQNTISNLLPNASPITDEITLQYVFEMTEGLNNDTVGRPYIAINGGVNGSANRLWLTRQGTNLPSLVMNIDGVGATAPYVAVNAVPGDIVDLRARWKSDEGATLWAYLNGVSQGSDTHADVLGTLTDPLENISINCQSLSPGVVWQPTTTLHCQIWDSALDPAQITALSTWDRVRPPIGFFHAFTAGLGQFAHTRASVATVMDDKLRLRDLAQDDSGVLYGDYIAPNEWGDTGYSRGLQVERSATNLCPHSYDLSSWIETGSALVSSGHTAPDGTATAHKINVNSDATNTLYLQGGGFTADAPVAISFWVKEEAGVNWRIYNTVGSGKGRWDIDASLLSGEWEWITADHPAVTVDTPFVADASGNCGIQFRAFAVTDTGFLPWGVQYEEGSVVSSYIPTSGSSVTRAMTLVNQAFDQSPNLPAAGVTNDFCGQFSFQMQTSMADATNQQGFISLFPSDGSSTDLLTITKYQSNGFGIRIRRSSVFSTQFAAPHPDVAFLQPGAIVDVRFRQSSTSGLKFWMRSPDVNGGDFVTAADASSGPPDKALATICVGTMEGQYNNYLSHFTRIIPQALTDAEIESWASWTLPALPPQTYVHDFYDGDLGGFTFTRASDAWAENDQRILTQHAQDVPPYVRSANGVNTGYAQGVLVEDTATTYLQYNTQFASWTNRGNALVSDARLAPDGTATAAELDLGDSGIKDLYRVIDAGRMQNSVATAVSVYVQSLDGNVFTIGNPQTGTIGLWTVDGSLVMDGWHRIHADHPAVTVTNPFMSRDNGAGGLHFYAPDGAKVMIWGGNVVEGSGVSSFIYQGSEASATRALTSIRQTFDNLPNLPAAGFTNNYCGQVIVHLHCDFVDLDQYACFFSLTAIDGNTNAQIKAFNVSGYLRLHIRTPNETYAQIDASSWTAGIYDIRFRRDDTQGLKLWVNGLTASNSNATSMEPHTDPIQHFLVSDTWTNQVLNSATVVHARVHPTTLTDEEIEAWPSWDLPPTPDWPWELLGTTALQSAGTIQSGAIEQIPADPVYFEDFTAPGATAENWSITRAGYATYDNGDGTVTFINSINSPAIGPRGLQVEISSTNYANNSAGWTGWTYFGSPLIGTGYTDPAGTTKAARFSISSNGTTNYPQHILPDSTFVASRKIAPSIWIKYISGATGGGRGIQFREASTTRGLWTIYVEHLPVNEWVRLERTSPFIIDVSNEFHASSTGSFTLQIRGEVVLDSDPLIIELAFPQIEENYSQESTSYIETTDATSVTRPAAACKANFAALGLPTDAVNDFCGQVVYEHIFPMDNVSNYRIGTVTTEPTSFDNVVEAEMFWSTTKRILMTTAINNVDTELSHYYGDNDWPEANYIWDWRFRKSSTNGIKNWINGTVYEDVGLTGAFPSAIQTMTLGCSAGSNLQSAGMIRQMRICAEEILDTEIEAWSPVEQTEYLITMGYIGSGTYYGFEQGAYGSLDSNPENFKQIVYNTDGDWFIIWIDDAQTHPGSYRRVSINGVVLEVPWHTNGYWRLDNQISLKNVFTNTGGIYRLQIGLPEYA